jgi:hypothetical protein
MAWILKRAAVLLATLIMITSCAGSDQSTPPPKTTAALAFSQSEATGIAMAPKLAQDNVADWREDGVVAGAFVSRNGWAYTIKAGSYGGVPPKKWTRLTCFRGGFQRLLVIDR